LNLDFYIVKILAC